MENTLELLKKWILKSAKSGKIKISKLNWPERYNLPVYDYMISVTVADKVFKGHGTSRDEDTAICKAMSEAFERFCITHFNFKNSNGCAVHIDKKLSEKNARFELIERDAFLYKFIKAEKFKLTPERCFKTELPSDCKLQNYLIAEAPNFVVLTRILINEFSSIFGMGISENIEESFEESFEKSEIEALRQWAYIYDNKLHKSANYQIISQKEKMSFDDHGDLALTPEYFKKIETLFDQGKASADTYKVFDLTKTKLESFNVELNSSNPFCGVPLVFSRAINEGAQGLFTGRTMDNINSSRIFAEPGRKLNLCLHPFR